jgi:hypothetical protein
MFMLVKPHPIENQRFQHFRELLKNNNSSKRRSKQKEKNYSKHP